MNNNNTIAGWGEALDGYEEVEKGTQYLARLSAES
jgi:hypothetical protein